MRCRLVTASLSMALLAASACGAGGDDRPVTLVLGDSISVISQEQMEARLGDDYSLVVKANEGWTVADQLPAAEALADTEPDIVVVNLGTNDVAQGNTDLVSDMEEILSLYRGQTCRVVVTVTSVLVQPERVELANELNAYIRGVDNWVVADWDELVQEYVEADEPDGPLTVDTIHPTDVGKEKLADLLADALAEC